MENDFSAIRSLQELKNLLDAGAITQQEYDTLKKKIIFGKSDSEPAAGTPLPTSHIAPSPEQQRNEAYVAYDNGARRPHNPDALGPEGVGEGGDLAEPKRKDMLVTILVTLGVLLLLSLITYQLMNNQDSSENLTSTSRTETAAADTALAFGTGAALPRPDTGTAVAAPLPDTGGAAIDGTAASAAAPELPNLQEEEIISRAKDRLESYYDDMRSAPFSADRHFAASVAQYYNLMNTTPAAINNHIDTTHFPEFQDSEAAIEAGSMKVSAVPGGFEVTYIENGTAFRKSRNQKQQTKARIRARFDPGFKINYFRQEALLENNFVE
jgi:hypothetical protein